MFYGLRFLSLRYWLRHRGAFVLAALGVALGIAVFVAIQIANASVLGAFSASLDATTGKANLQIRGGPNGLPDALVARLKTGGDPRILAVAPFSARTLFSPTLQTSILVAGVDLFSEIDFRAFDLESEARGEETKPPLDFLLDGRAIALSSSLAKRGALKVGSELQLLQGPTRQTLSSRRFWTMPRRAAPLAAISRCSTSRRRRKRSAKSGKSIKSTFWPTKPPFLHSFPPSKAGAARCHRFASGAKERAGRGDSGRVSTQSDGTVLDCDFRGRVFDLQRARFRRRAKARRSGHFARGGRFESADYGLVSG